MNRPILLNEEEEEEEDFIPKVVASFQQDNSIIKLLWVKVKMFMSEPRT